MNLFAIALLPPHLATRGTPANVRGLRAGLLTK
jgi:hypothetical protein